MGDYDQKFNDCIPDGKLWNRYTKRSVKDTPRNRKNGAITPTYTSTNEEKDAYHDIFHVGRIGHDPCLLTQLGSLSVSEWRAGLSCTPPSPPRSTRPRPRLPSISPAPPPPTPDTPSSRPPDPPPRTPSPNHPPPSPPAPPTYGNTYRLCDRSTLRN